MGVKVSDHGGSFELAPQGVSVARCTRVIDLGTQQTTYMGKPKVSPKVLIGWELLSAERMEDGRPYLVYSQYTASLHENAQLRAMLKSWRGRDFTAEELEEFDLSKILGVPCQLNIVHTEDGKYANVAAIMPLPSGMTAPKAEGEIIDFSFADFRQSEFDKLTDRLKEKIMATPEWAERQASRESIGRGVAAIDDDIPFLFNICMIRDTMGLSNSLMRARHGKGLSILRANQVEC